MSITHGHFTLRLTPLPLFKKTTKKKKRFCCHPGCCTQHTLRGCYMNRNEEKCPCKHGSMDKDCRCSLSQDTSLKPQKTVFDWKLSAPGWQVLEMIRIHPLGTMGVLFLCNPFTRLLVRYFYRKTKTVNLMLVLEEKPFYHLKMMQVCRNLCSNPSDKSWNISAKLVMQLTNQETLQTDMPSTTND